jgi:2-oxoglutarate dehydrogenase E1 component
MAPKSLLRHPSAVSPVGDFVGGSFQEILDDPVHSAGEGGPAAGPVDRPAASNVERLILCSGKVYYDLLERRDRERLDRAAIVRIEQLYPLHAKRLGEIARFYGGARLIWCQEESQNMGAWTWIAPQLEAIFGRKPTYAGRDASSSPSVGLLAMHRIELEALLNDAFAL